jgi:hypothetical protein
MANKRNVKTLTVNQRVAGSSPAGGAKAEKRSNSASFLLFKPIVENPTNRRTFQQYRLATLPY